MLEEVNGTVIGSVDTKRHYSFHCNGNPFDSGNFENDDEAIEYIKHKWPAKYSAGVEMRCYNR